MNQQTGSSSNTTKGFWFFFEIDGLKIAAQTTVWSTYKESIYVNDELVSTKRSLRGSGTHRFVVNGKTYQVSFKVMSVWEGELVCELYEAGNLISTKSSALYNDNQLKELIIGIATAFIISFVFSFLITSNI